MNDNLTHHGVKGQKWGVRRYQNNDVSIIKSEKKKLTKGHKMAIGILAAFGTMSVITAISYVKSAAEINKNLNGIPLKTAKSILNPLFFIKELTR